MSSKQRVFSHSYELNYNDYFKNKNGVEVLKNIKGNQQFNGTKYPCGMIINKFSNHTDLINLTKTYHNYANSDKYSLQATRNLYNSNISFVNNKIYNYNNNNNSIISDSTEGHCNRICKKSILYNDCAQSSQVLYPESSHISKNNRGSQLHFNLNLNDLCSTKCKVDYNKIYNSECVKININGFNGCINGDECCDVREPTEPSGHNSKTCCCKKTKCKTGLCKKAKPLFICNFDYK
jgi:hypothetical protein